MRPQNPQVGCLSLIVQRFTRIAQTFGGWQMC